MDWQAKALERFLRYVAIDTQSREDCNDSPSSPGQLVLARMLEEELKSLGLESVQLTPYGILLGKIPASCGWEEVPPLGLIAHLDTSDEASGKNVEPQIVTYSGGVIPLGDSGKVLDPEVFPFLKTLVGQTLVTTNGCTLLGADDKAGIAEIVTMAEALLANTVPHGVIYVVFTPDEELGRGVKHFPFALFPAKYAFTIDGCAGGEIEYKNFNAAAAKVTFFGRSVHPGAAKDIMINAQTLAFEFARLLPAEEVPEKTCKEEGFFHLTDSSGTVSQACLHYIIRDHNREKFEARKQLLKNLAAQFREKYGQNAVKLDLQDQYCNMEEIIAEHFFLIRLATSAAESAGLTVQYPPIRGGTDGAQLSFKGIPCPNLGSGGYNFHGEYEVLSVDQMGKVVQMLIFLAGNFREAVSAIQ